MFTQTHKITSTPVNELIGIANTQCHDVNDFISIINDIMAGWEDGLSLAQEKIVREEYANYLNS